MGKTLPASGPKRYPPATLRTLNRSEPASFGNGLPALVFLLFLAHMATLFSIELAMTPYTNNLDDIKQTIYYICTPLLMTVALICIWIKAAPLPPRWVGLGLAAYWLIMIISTLVMSSGLRPEIARHIRWMGWDQVIMIWGAGGLFLSAFVSGSHQKTNVWFVRYLVVQWLVVNLIGFMMFDMLSVGGNRSVVGWLFNHLYTKQPAQGDDLFQLLATLKGADTQLQSTILNRDFYAGISLLYLPFCLLLTLDPGPGRHSYYWRIVGGITAFLTTMSIFLCQSKGEYIFWCVMITYFLLMFLRFGYTAGLRRRHLLAGIAASVMVLGVLGWMKSPTLISNLKSLNLSLSSRKIMWYGAWRMFQEFPILGGGPGSFRVYFSTYRAPDYFLHEIANVTTYSHNYFLDLLSETGLLGLAAFLTFLCALWFGGLRRAIKHPDGRIRMLLIACTASLIGMYGSNLSSPNARWIIGASNLWTVMGFFAGSLRLADAWHPAAEPLPATAHPVPPRLVRQSLVGVLALSLPMLILSIRSGTSYWSSAAHYADGLQYMEYGMHLLDQQDGGKNVDVEYAKDVLVHACGLFEDAIKADENNVSAYYKVGSVYSTLDRIFDGAANHVRQTNPKDAEALQATADEYCKLALERYEKLDQLMPDYAEIHFNFGIVYDRMAGILRRELARGSPENSRQLTQQIEYYEKKTQEHLERMHQLSIKEDVYLQLGDTYEVTGMLNEALRVYKEAVGRYPDNLKLLSKYHDTALQTNHYDEMFEALRLLWRAQRLDNEYVQRMLTIGIEYKLAPQLAQLANDIMKTNPLDSRVYFTRAQLAEWLNNPQKVIEEVTRYQKVGGRQITMYEKGVKAALALGQIEKANEFKRYIEAINRQQPKTG